MPSVVRQIHDLCARHGSRTALVELAWNERERGYERASETTYASLLDQTLRLADALARRGVRPGDRVAVLFDNSVELALSEWACLLSGMVWVALNARSSANEHASILADCTPKAVLVGRRYRDRIDERALPPGCVVVESGDAWHELLASGSPRVPAHEPGAEDPVRIRYTSGTAGKPKGAVLPRRCYDASVEVVGDVLAPILDGDMLAQVAPMTHAAGAMWLPHAVGGATALRTIRYGGASMPADRLERGLELLGPVFVQIYGLTESNWPVTALGREEHVVAGSRDARARRLRSCGRPTPVGEVRIVRADGSECAPGEAGEMLVRGRNTMLGYWGGHAEDVKGLDADGWMHTGDVAAVDDDGFVTIVDRLHDMIVSGGFNVYPREVEEALSQHPAVLEAAVVGRADAEWGERVHAVVVLRPGAEVSEADLAAHVAERTAAYKKPRSFEFVRELPKNAAGKVLRRAFKTTTPPA